MTKFKPKISVVMPVYNGEKYLREAIDSILNQTFKDFEFIIIDDGSTDSTIEIIKSYKDSKIILLQHTKNQGISKSLNDGISIAKGNYIARMDADDISLPNRLQTQYEFMENNPDIDISGTWTENLDNPNQKFKTLIGDRELKTQLLFTNCFLHPTVIFKKTSILDNNLRYKDKYCGVEDIGLWCDTALAGLKFQNIPKVLLRYRLSINYNKKYPDRLVLENEIKKNYKNKSKHKIKFSYKILFLNYLSKLFIYSKNILKKLLGKM